MIEQEDNDMSQEVLQQQHTKMSMFKQGVITGIPITLGYIPVAITFGVLAMQSGLTLLELTMMSALVYAGASQFMGVNMIVAQASMIEIVIATFVLNFRHFIMSLSFMNSIRDHVALKGRIGVSLGLTDESFALASMNQEKADNSKAVYFYTGIFLSGYLAWVIGSLVGGVLGEVIPQKLSESMGIALYALFISLLVPSVKKEKRFGFIALIAMLINTIAVQFMSSGWAIVVGTVLGGLSGVILLKEKST